MCKGIDPAEAGEVEQQHLANGEHDVYQPKRLGRVRDEGRELFLVRTCRLSLYEAETSNAQKRNERDRKRDDPHAAEPVRLAPPEVDASRQRLYFLKHRSARRREAAHALEYGVGKRGERAAEVQGYGPVSAYHDPNQPDDSESAFDVKHLWTLSHCEPKCYGNDPPGKKRYEKNERHPPIGIHQCHRQRQQERRSSYAKDVRENPENRKQHGTSLFPANPGKEFSVAGPDDQHDV